MIDLHQPSFQKNQGRAGQALAEVRIFLRGLDLKTEEPPGPQSEKVIELIRLSRRIEDRLTWGSEASLFVSVIGATGTGKSKIFNSLIGRPLSPSGFKRPTTIAPVLLTGVGLNPAARRPPIFPGYEIHIAGDEPLVFNPTQTREVIAATTDDPAFEHLILLDTPDFDSVIAENRVAAKEIFDRADMIVFVLDPIKYADQAVWDYLDRIGNQDREAVLVFNRLKNPLSLDDFVNRLKTAGLNRPILTIPDYSGLDDQVLLPPGLETVDCLRQNLVNWSGPRRLELLSLSFSRDWEQFRTDLQNNLVPELRKTQDGLGRLRRMLIEATDQVKTGLAPRLTVAISGELKDNLIAQIQALFLKWDVLKYPRRIMGLPWTLLRDKVLAPMNIVGKSTGGRSTLDQEMDRLFEANQETMVQVIREFNQKIKELFRARTPGRGLSIRPEFETAVQSEAAVRAAYRQIRLDLENWVASQAQELVKDLKLSEKMTFYLAQVISLGLCISLQVHTGGFSFFDAVLDTVLAPVFSKITGHALSREKVRTFEENAGKIHLEGCQRLVTTQAEAYLDILSRAELGLAPLSPLAAAAGNLFKAFEPNS